MRIWPEPNAPQAGQKKRRPGLFRLVLQRRQEEGQALGDVL